MCAAPKGNKFALGNSGREKQFSSPKELEQFIDEYFKWCDENPIITEEYNGKEPKLCYLRTQRPYTVEGLCLHLNVTRQTLLNYENKEGYEEYFDILSRAKRKILENNITYGMTGAYNAGLVKFLLTNNSEYREKQDINLGGQADNPLTIKIGDQEFNV